MLRLCLTAMILTTLVAATAQLVFWYGRLPDPVPTHFDGSGKPDGWGSRAGLVTLMGFLHLLFLVGFPWLGTQLQRLPDSMINLPHKPYWLAPERRDASLIAVRNVLDACGILTSWLCLGIFQMNAGVAMGTRESIAPEFWGLFSSYLLLTLLLCVVLWRRFATIPRKSDLDSGSNTLE